jgi:LPPG:FO 2-phospho-L-lactate transferase
VAYDGAAVARPHPEIIAALADPQLRAIVICPSNPYLSIEPILAVAGMRAAIAACPAPVVAVSPIIGGRAVKGPTAKMMTELGVPVTAAAIARRYADLIDAYVLDEIDAAEAARLSIPATPLPTLMTTLQDRERLARQVLACADAVRSVPA